MKNLHEIYIKLRGHGNASGEHVDNYMKEYHQSSQAHPFNAHARIVHNTITHLSKDGNEVHIHDIQTLESGKGHATKALKHLTNLADKHNVKLNLHAKAYSKDKTHIRSSKKLSDWYKKHGFDYDDEEYHPDDHHDGVDMKYYPK